MSRVANLLIGANAANPGLSRIRTLRRYGRIPLN
jgi:hypothetical protein